MTNNKIVGLFPTPIYTDKLNRKLSLEELSFVDEAKLNTHKNVGNIGSNDNYILDNEIFKHLKEELYLRVHDYFDAIFCPANKIIPYITQSWLNYTETNQFHHRHSHNNSIVSGVFYINCNENFDKIKFYDNTYKLIAIEPKEWNIWNSQSWTFPIKTGDIILFPSSLDHEVQIKEGSNTRISLAFNVFIKGTIGSNRNLTELVL